MTALDDLRAAAKLLRERAEAASKGPWVAHTDGLVWPPRLGDPVSGSTETEDADYIATVHPCVGLAVAAWLDLVADLWVPKRDVVHYAAREQVQDAAVVVARTILGRTDG